MLTVLEAAQLAGKDARTIRGWIRSGRLMALKVGTHYVIDERDLEPMVADEQLPVPSEWARLPDGRPLPNVVRAIRLAREGR